MLSYFNITVIAEWLALIASIICLNKDAGVWKFFIPLLFLSITVETVGWYQSHVLAMRNNAFLFNFLMIIQFSYFIYLFSVEKTLYSVRRSIVFILLFFLFLSVINLLFFQGFFVYNYISETLGNIILVVVSYYFFYRLLLGDKFINIFQYEYFWFTAGLLLSSLGSTVLYFFLEPLQNVKNKTQINVYGYINYFLNSCFYLSLIIAFVCRKKKSN